MRGKHVRHRYQDYSHRTMHGPAAEFQVIVLEVDVE